jgi:hypothetical protein
MFAEPPAVAGSVVGVGVAVEVVLGSQRQPQRPEAPPLPQVVPRHPRIVHLIGNAFVPKSFQDLRVVDEEHAR